MTEEKVNEQVETKLNVLSLEEQLTEDQKKQVALIKEYEDKTKQAINTIIHIVPCSLLICN